MLTEFAFLFLLRKAVEEVNCDPNDEIMTHLLYGEHSSCEKPCIKFSHPLKLRHGARSATLFSEILRADPILQFSRGRCVAGGSVTGEPLLEKIHGEERGDPRCKTGL